jgi:hypothetical protein
MNNVNLLIAEIFTYGSAIPMMGNSKDLSLMFETFSDRRISTPVILIKLEMG